VKKKLSQASRTPTFLLAPVSRVTARMLLSSHNKCRMRPRSSREIKSPLPVAGFRLGVGAVRGTERNTGRSRALPGWTLGAADPSKPPSAPSLFRGSPTPSRWRGFGLGQNPASRPYPTNAAQAEIVARDWPTSKKAPPKRGLGVGNAKSHHG
jgi:hypothetical protein